MGLKDEIERMLSSGPRVERAVDAPDEAMVVPDIQNLKAAVGELQQAVVRLSEEIERRS
jgi:hypothetical protein